MRAQTRAMLDEVAARYTVPDPRHHRCGLYTCQEEGECAFPNACVSQASDLSSDRVSEAQIAAGVPAECTGCGTHRPLAFYEAQGARSCCPERDMRRVAAVDPRYVMSLEELTWRREGAANHWAAPARRPRWRRLPVIRHLAALRLSWQVHTFAAGWARAGIGIGIGGPNPHDLWVVEGYLHGYV